MRKTFTLLVEFRGDMQGYEQLKVAMQIQAFAEQQDIQTFGFEDGDTGTYAFMANPVLVDEKEDSYKVGVLRGTLDSWLMLNQDIDSFTLQPITELSELFPRIGDSPLQPENLTNRNKLFKAIT